METLASAEQAEPQSISIAVARASRTERARRNELFETLRQAMLGRSKDAIPPVGPPRPSKSTGCLAEKPDPQAP